MLEEQVKKFGESGRQFTSKEIVAAYNRLRERLSKGILMTMSEESEKRENLYRQIRSLDALLDELVSVWSLK